MHVAAFRTLAIISLNSRPTSCFESDPLGLFLSMSSIILAFAFMIGSASSKYFEGLLFILVRRYVRLGLGLETCDWRHQADISP